MEIQVVQFGLIHTERFVGSVCPTCVDKIARKNEPQIIELLNLRSQVFDEIENQLSFFGPIGAIMEICNMQEGIL